MPPTAAPFRRLLTAAPTHPRPRAFAAGMAATLAALALAGAAAAFNPQPAAAVAPSGVPQTGWPPRPPAGVAGAGLAATAVDATPAVEATGISTLYPGDDASRQQIATWMSGEAHRRGLPGELPVMASLADSGLRNLPGGDADSIGFFQMRDSIWNKGAYAGYADKPELQLRWFLDQADRLKGAGYGHDAAGLGRWAADVQRPPEGLRGRYAGQFEIARTLLRSRS